MAKVNTTILQTAEYVAAVIEISRAVVAVTRAVRRRRRRNPEA